MSNSDFHIDEIVKAAKDRRFFLTFQPIVDFSGVGNHRYETFIRVRDRVGKEIPASSMIKEMHDHGLASKFDRWVIANVLKLLRKKTEAGEDIQFFINLSTTTIEDASFASWLQESIENNGVGTLNVVLEFRSKNVAEDSEGTIQEFFDRIRATGVQIAIDKYSKDMLSIESLEKIKPDFVKLDGTYAEALDRGDSMAESRTRDVVLDMQDLGVRMVATSVESVPVLMQMAQLGITLFQGHALQMPSQDLDFDFSLSPE